MSGHIITIRGTRTDCWISPRYSSDEAQGERQSCEEEWFDFLAAHAVLDYAEFAEGKVRLPGYFTFLRAPIVC